MQQRKTVSMAIAVGVVLMVASQFSGRWQPILLVAAIGVIAYAISATSKSHAPEVQSHAPDVSGPRPVQSRAPDVAGPPLRTKVHWGLATARVLLWVWVVCGLALAALLPLFMHFIGGFFYHPPSSTELIQTSLQVAAVVVVGGLAIYVLTLLLSAKDEAEAARMSVPNKPPSVPMDEAPEAAASRYEIAFDGTHYRFRAYRYERLEDALAYAKLLEQRGAL